MDGGKVMVAIQKVVVSFSGGMDSTSLVLRYLANGYHVVAVSFLYGQKHSFEIECAKKTIALLQKIGCNINHEIADLSSAMNLFTSALLSHDAMIPEGHYEEEQMKATVVPNRNAIFSSLIYGKALSIAIQHDENVKIGLGVHSGDHAIYPDCRPEFYDAIHDAFTLGNWDSEKVSFDLPYLHGNKSTILKDALASCETLGLDFNEVFVNTLTSYNPDSMGRSSGKSGSDIERILAFHDIGRKDPIEYQDSWGNVLHHALEIQRRHQDERYKDTLSDLEYYVTRQGGTERPYTGALLHEKRIGTYTCKCCHHPLFDSGSKFDSGCGWPAFHTEMDGADIVRIEDRSHGMIRVEVRCKHCDAHLGHVFEDGPKQHGGERYCINSVSMNFTGVEE